MKKDETVSADKLGPEYDLRSLRVRKLGPGRKRFGDVIQPRSDIARPPDANSEETAYLLNSETMRRRLLEAREGDEGISLENVSEKLGI